jgi:hypothetical protein
MQHIVTLEVGLRDGVFSFGTPFAGLDGCPFTEAATGNVVIEDFVNTL